MVFQPGHIPKKKGTCWVDKDQLLQLIREEATGISPQARRRLADPRIDLIRCARLRARDKGLEFNLEVSDIVVPEYCPVLGIKVYVNVGKRRFQ
jgi:hypothetical protein